MKKTLFWVVGLSIPGFLTVPACEKKAEAPQPEKAIASAQEVAAPTKPAKQSPPSGSLAKVMTGYEQCRALLAADQGDLASCAKAIGQAARALPESAGSHRSHVVSAADKLSKTDAKDLDALRLAFGDVSQGVVGLLENAPDQAQNYHVFECPMAKGYKRWVQTDTELANPYMGQKMLACGSAVKPAGHDAMKHGEHNEH